MENKKEIKKDQKRKDNKKPFKKAPVKTLDEIIVETKAVVKVTNPVTQVALAAVNKLSRYGAGFRSLHMGKDNKMLPNKIIIQKLKTNI